MHWQRICTGNKLIHLHHVSSLSIYSETNSIIVVVKFFREAPFIPSNTPLFMERRVNPNSGPRRTFYSPILSRVRYTMISRMAKPEEVLVVENENGEVVREFMKDTDSINLYKNMRETLVYLTHLDCQDTEKIMTKKLQNQVNGTEWSWKNLNTVSLPTGSRHCLLHVPSSSSMNLFS